jgi:hypothetical protein
MPETTAHQINALQEQIDKGADEAKSYLDAVSSFCFDRI